MHANIVGRFLMWRKFFSLWYFAGASGAVVLIACAASVHSWHTPAGPTWTTKYAYDTSVVGDTTMLNTLRVDRTSDAVVKSAFYQVINRSPGLDWRMGARDMNEDVFCTGTGWVVASCRTEFGPR